MGKPVLSVGERPTNLSFELPEHLTARAYSFVVANATTRGTWIPTSKASSGCDYGSVGVAYENESLSAAWSTMIQLSPPD